MQNVTSKREKARAAAEAVAIEAYLRNTGGPTRERLLAALPGLAALSERLEALPLRVGDAQVHHLAHFANSDEISACAIGSACARGQERGKGYRGFGAGLDAYWNSKTRPIYEGDWHGPSFCGTADTTMCFRAGHCVQCTLQGRRLRAFRNAVLRQMKMFAPRESREREWLRTGFIVLRLRGRPRQTFFGGASGAAADSSDEGLEDLFKFWHVSSLLLSPYIPVFMEMHCKDADEPMAFPMDADIELEVARARESARVAPAHASLALGVRFAIELNDKTTSNASARVVLNACASQSVKVLLAA